MKKVQKGLRPRAFLLNQALLSKAKVAGPHKSKQEKRSKAKLSSLIEQQLKEGKNE